MKRLIYILLVLVSQLSFAAQDCTMQPTPIDLKRLSRSTEIKSYVVAKDKLSLTALLKNGDTFHLVHMGCQHSGAELSLWSTQGKLADRQAALSQAARVARTAFAPEVMKDITKALRNPQLNVMQQSAEGSWSATAHPSEGMTLEVMNSTFGDSAILTVRYWFN